MALFKREFLQPIIDGKKTQTRRLHRHTWKEGKAYFVRTSLYTSTPVKILTLKKFQQRLGDISEEDAIKEGFSSIDGFKEAWVRINKAWNPDLLCGFTSSKLSRKDISARMRVPKFILKANVHFLGRGL